ncbi:MAG: nucleoside permease [Flavobacteriales bacterium]|nr:nucleoside permease [Flavobacteriales bacterium]
MYASCIQQLNSFRMIKQRLTALSFLQFFIWGCWLITIGAFWFETKQWGPDQFGVIFSTMGISALFMPAIAGILSDRFINAEKLYGLLHILGGVCLFFVPASATPDEMFWRILLTMIFYMPTISLSNTVAYAILSREEGIDVVKAFPPIRVWGTVGFIVALWTVSLTGNETHAFQFYLGGVASLVLGIYSFTLPACPPLGKNLERKGFIQAFGLHAFSMFKNYRYAIFFLFAMLLGAALQLTNAYGDVFLHSFDNLYSDPKPLAVQYPAIISSIAQISETLFILAIPFFMKRFGIKQIMIISMVAWVLRFGLFAFGDPAGGLWMIVLSCIIYGMAFDFFNISGSLFIEKSVEPGIRSSAQGLFTMMVNGVGAVLGSRASGWVMEKYFTTYIPGENGKQIAQIDWHSTWLCFAGYSLVVLVLFVLLFREKKNVA